MPSSQPTTTQAEGDHEAEHGAEHAELLLKRKVLFFFSPEISSYFIAGGVAGAASRTVVSPLERLKIIQSVFIADPILTLTGKSQQTSPATGL
jgi:solute carrier family 25 phosphate transporter 23/24/25/41